MTDADLPRRIVSGGQTGVDRAALDTALALGIPCGGWVPHGRRAEDGRLAPRYPVRETDSDAYEPRTELNIRDSDATLILTRGTPTGGTRLTAHLAEEMGRPLLIVDLRDPPAPEAVRRWLAAEAVDTLNVAGPRESGAPGIHAQAVAFLHRVLAA